MSHKCMEDRLPPGTFSGIAIFITAFSVAIIFIIAVFITAFSIQGGSQSCAYNLIYIPCTQLALEHSSYMICCNIIFLLVLFVFGKAALLIATHGLSVYLHSHTGFPSQLHLAGKQPPILLWCFQLVCLLQLEESLFFQTPSLLLKCLLHGFRLVPITA